jgi:hypothetical protein
MWYLFVYYDLEKTKLLKIIETKTIRELGYLLDMKPSIVSNFYHKLINARGILKYCYLQQFG